MKWINSKQIASWAESPDAKADLPFLVARLIRATSALDTFLEFPAGAETYSGGWDGVVKCAKANSFVAEGISLWEMGTEAGVKGKADKDYEKRTKDPLGYIPGECIFVFVTPRRWSQKKKWVTAKKAKGIWKDVIVYDGVNLEQWLSDAPAVGWWLAVASGNMPSEGLLAADQCWREYAQSSKYTLAPSVLTAGRGTEMALLRDFLKEKKGSKAVQARSRDEAVAFILATAMQMDIQQREDFFSRTLVVNDPDSFRTLASTRFGLILIARFEDLRPIDGAVRNGHQVMVALGADDTHGAGTPLVLPQVGRDLEQALQDSGLSEDEARKYTVESGRDLTILRRQLQFPYASIKWAKPEYTPLLLPALFLGRWDESKKGDIALVEWLAEEKYDNYIEKLSRWKRDSHPFVYKIGSCWRLASALDAWSLLAASVTRRHLDRFEETVTRVLGEVKPMFELAPEKRFMASMYGKSSDYSNWTREGVCQSLILFALFGKSLQLPYGSDSQQWVDRVIGGLLSSEDGNLWRSVNDVMPLLAEAAPDRFLSIVNIALNDHPDVVLSMFVEDPSPLVPRSYHTGLLWALESLAWFDAYLERATGILAKLAAGDPGGTIVNRPINSLRAIYLAWLPQTYVDRFRRNEILFGLAKSDPVIAWELLKRLLPENHGVTSPTHKTRWGDFGEENINRLSTMVEIWETYGMVLSLSIDLAAYDEQRLAILIDAADNMLPQDRHRMFDHLFTIAKNIRQEDFSIVTALRNTLHHHRTCSGAPWALPETELAVYDRLLKEMEPTSTIEKYRWLFEERHPQFPELSSIDPLDHYAREALIREKRIEALNDIYKEFGFYKILELALSVRDKLVLGDTIAYCLNDERELLEVFLAGGLFDEANAQLGWGLASRSFELHGWDWAKQYYGLLKAKKLESIALGRFLSWVPLSSELYQFMQEVEVEVVSAYWLQVRPWLGALSDAEKIGVIAMLMTVGRYAEAIHQMNLYPKVCSTELLVLCLLGAAQNPQGEVLRPRSHEVEHIIDEIYARKDYNRNEMAKVEWICQSMISSLDRSRYTRTLQEEMAKNPTFFVEILELLYKPKSEDRQQEESKDEPDQKRKTAATLAYFLLSEWETIPAMEENGVIDGNSLNTWVEEARSLAMAKSRLDVADVHIGQVLAKYPDGTVGQWPPDEVCSVIDRINTRAIRSGFHTAIFNKRGVTSRAVFEGGAQERGMASVYINLAKAIALKWPITASVIEEVAQAYLSDSRTMDEVAERDSLDY